jgi:hypothetical protein
LLNANLRAFDPTMCRRQNACSWSGLGDFALKNRLVCVLPADLLVSQLFVSPWSMRTTVHNLDFARLRGVLSLGTLHTHMLCLGTKDWRARICKSTPVSVVWSPLAEFITVTGL